MSYNPIGIILTGGPKNVFAEDAPKCDPRVFEAGIPVLGICYGAQLFAYLYGGEVSRAPQGEYGKTEIAYQAGNSILTGLPQSAICWMSHMNYVSKAPEGYEIWK